jgi:hypothetical protein
VATGSERDDKSEVKKRYRIQETGGRLPGTKRKAVASGGRMLGKMRALVLGVVVGLVGCNKEEAPRSGTIPVTADAEGFSPSSVTVKKGSPATLVFTRTSDQTCADKVVFPEINVTKELPLHKPVSIDVPTDTARTLTFQCGMGMFKSSVVVK